MISPVRAMENLRRLEREGALSRYGLYEALDFTPERVKKGENCTVVRAFMAHHQGMSLIALDNLLNGEIMANRFHSDPAVQATELTFAGTHSARRARRASARRRSFERPHRADPHRSGDAGLRLC
jgi:hypothetical protein